MLRGFGWTGGRVGAGFTKEEKVEVNGVLAGVCKQLKRSGSVRKIFQIRGSRVPIIKARAPDS